MKQVPPAVLDYLLNNEEVIIGHLYTFETASGAFDYLTDLDIDVNYGGIHYRANGPRIEQIGFKLAIGTEVDEQTMRITATPDDVLCGAAFFAALPNGLLDGAYVRRQRIFWAVVSGSTWRDVQLPPLGVIDPNGLSYMRISTITKLGRTTVELKLKSPLVLFNQVVPHRFYAASCGWMLFQPADSDGYGCTMSKSAFAVTYAVGAGTSPLAIFASNVVGSVDPGPGITVGWQNGQLVVSANMVPTAQSPGYSYDGVPSFSSGRLLFTSGALRNVQISVSTNDGAAFYPLKPLAALPAVGDTFTAYAGCQKSTANCGLKFGIGAAGGPYVAVVGSLGGGNWSGNLANYGGFDFVPSEHIGL